MRDYLRARGVEFDDRNIRHSAEAREELRLLRSDLLVPLLTFRDRTVVGFDPEALDAVIEDYRELHGA